MTVTEILNEAKEKIKKQTGCHLVNIKYDIGFNDGILPGTVLDNLRKVVTEVTGISWEKIRSKCREREICEARHLFLAFARDTYGVGLVRLGRILNRNHSSVIVANKKIKDLLFIGDPDITLKYNLIKNCLHEIQTQPA